MAGLSHGHRATGRRSSAGADGPGPDAPDKEPDEHPGDEPGDVGEDRHPAGDLVDPERGQPVDDLQDEPQPEDA